MRNKNVKTTSSTNNLYLAYFKGKQRDIYAPSLDLARSQAMRDLNVPKGFQHQLHVHLVKAVETFPEKKAA